MQAYACPHPRPAFHPPARARTHARSFLARVYDFLGVRALSHGELQAIVDNDRDRGSKGTASRPARMLLAAADALAPCDSRGHNPPATSADVPAFHAADAAQPCMSQPHSSLHFSSMIRHPLPPSHFQCDAHKLPTGPPPAATVSHQAPDLARNRASNAAIFWSVESRTHQATIRPPPCLQIATACSSRWGQGRGAAGDWESELVAIYDLIITGPRDTNREAVAHATTLRHGFRDRLPQGRLDR